jgi:hypothetical protein
MPMRFRGFVRLQPKVEDPYEVVFKFEAVMWLFLDRKGAVSPVCDPTAIGHKSKVARKRKLNFIS